MNYIYIGSPKNEAIMDMISKSGSLINFAANTLQNALLDGFSALCNEIKVISAWGTTTYPKVKHLFYPHSTYFSDSKSSKIEFVGSINLPVVNLLDRFIRVRKALKRSIVDGERNYLIVYEMHTPYLLAVATLRKRLDKVCLVVPDLPQFMSGNKGFLYTLAKKIDWCIINSCLKSIDCYALLSEPMTEKLPMEGKTWVLMEGIFQREDDEVQVKKELHKTIMYTGNIYKRRGIDLLLDAFALIKDSDYRLWIRGNGDMKNEILERSKLDPRIIYFEPMSMSDLRKLERRATVMVNSTPPSMDFTNYFFPSKTMEYLASGTPTIMFRLGCMPKEYDQYIYYVEEESIYALRDKLVEVCEKPVSELTTMGQYAKDFILSKKAPKVQCKKILDLIINE